MLSIYPEVPDFGHKDETNYETDEMNKENMKESCIFTAVQNSESTKSTTKYDKQTLWKFSRKKNEYRGVKDVLFSTEKLS